MLSKFNEQLIWNGSTRNIQLLVNIAMLKCLRSIYCNVVDMNDCKIRSEYREMSRKALCRSLTEYLILMVLA